MKKGGMEPPYSYFLKNYLLGAEIIMARLAAS
jgi:hypothetical protein